MHFCKINLYKSMKCALIAKDTNMVLCEYSVADCNPRLTAELKRKVKSITSSFEKTRTEEGNFIAIKTDVLIFACLSDNSLKEERLPQFLEELKEAFAAFYKSDLENIHKQTNLEENILDVPFQKSFMRLFDKYNTGINMTNIQVANSKIDSLKRDMGKTIENQFESNKTTQEFHETSDALKLNARLFEKVTHDLEKTAERSNFWMCSRKCILIFAISGAVIAAAITIICLVT
eukprot:TRINITY_DN16079_c0_g1_i2.p1 TRINITY_DN16079_c0_g1~~TRINITY_DN16079_c0_g1_i2.p1  ORF type:complete len:233 (-),score=69.64 TRINITY_DN16079_c0_g1_i2:159-857(-)